MDHFIGIDVHRKFSEVCVLEEGGEVLVRRKLYHDEPETIEAFFDSFPPGTPVTMESSFGWMWLAQMLQDLGMEVKLAHSAKVRYIAEARLKNDTIDAWVLAHLLRTGFLPIAYLAPSSVRDNRMVLRHREALKRSRTRMKNRVHALLARHNIHIDLTDIFGVGGMEILRILQVPEPTRRVLDSLLDTVEFLDEEIAQVQKHIASRLKKDPRVEWLESLPGVGRLTSYYLLAEIGEIERFRCPKKLVSYAGLCPSTRQSGAKIRHGPIGGGRRLLRWVLIEAAHTASRRDGYFGHLFQSTKRRKEKNTAYVTVARKMTKIIWQMLTEGRPYQRKVTTTPRVGPSRAMVAR